MLSAFADVAGVLGVPAVEGFEEVGDVLGLFFGGPGLVGRLCGRTNGDGFLEEAFQRGHRSVSGSGWQGHAAARVIRPSVSISEWVRQIVCLPVFVQ